MPLFLFLFFQGKWVPVLTTTGHIGKYGFASATNMHEGGKKSPIGTAFGRYGNPGTKMPYRKITIDDVWVDDPTSKLYNTWQSRSKTRGQWKSAENLNISAYTYGFVINYNTQRTPYKGSAIFLGMILLEPSPKSPHFLWGENTILAE